MIDTKKLRELHAKLVAGEQALPWHIEHCGAKDCWCRMVIGKGVYKVPNSSLTCDYVIPSGAVGEAQAEVIVFFANEMPKLLDELEALRAAQPKKLSIDRLEEVELSPKAHKLCAKISKLLERDTVKLKNTRRKSRHEFNKRLAREIRKSRRS